MPVAIMDVARLLINLRIVSFFCRHSRNLSATIDTPRPNKCKLLDLQKNASTDLA